MFSPLSKSTKMSNEIKLSHRPYANIERAPAVTEFNEWLEPTNQSWDTKAIFEIFTPPLIYYDKKNKSFTLSPPIEPKIEINTFGISLVDIVKDKYRLQFEGYIGSLSDPIGSQIILLNNLSNGKGIRCNVGDRFDDLKFSVKSIDINREPIQPEDPTLTPYIDEIVTVVISDMELGTDITLSNKSFTLMPTSAALLISLKNPENVFKVYPGDFFVADNYKYSLQNIDFKNRSVTVIKTSLNNNNPKTKILTISNSAIHK